MTKEDKERQDPLRDWRRAEDGAEDDRDDGDIWNIKKMSRDRMTQNGTLGDQEPVGQKPERRDPADEMKMNGAARRTGEMQAPADIRRTGNIRRTGEIQTGGGFSRKTTDAVGVKFSDVSMAFVEREVQNPKSREVIVALETVAKRCRKAGLHERVFLEAFQSEKLKAGAFLPVYLQDFAVFLAGKTVSFQDQEWVIEVANSQATAKDLEENETPHLPVCHKGNGRKALLTLLEIMGGLRYY